MSNLFFAKTTDHALVAYLISKYNEVPERPLGRTVLQKLCYLAKANGVPLSISFDIHHYGPFAAGLFRITDDLLADKVIVDQSGEKSVSQYAPGETCNQLLRHHKTAVKKQEKVLDQIIALFCGMLPSQLELITTIHYIFCSLQLYRKPNREAVVNTVSQIKGDRFSRSDIKRTYEALEAAGLLAWSPRESA